MEYSKISKSPVMLSEENRTYAQDPGKQIRGCLKLERSADRGLIILIMDNVKFFPRGEYVYKLLLAGKYREKLRYHMVGNISLTAEGKGEGSYRINPRDLDGCGTALALMDTAIVAAMSTVNSREPLHPVLKGRFAVEAETPEAAAPNDGTARAAGAGPTEAEATGAGLKMPTATGAGSKMSAKAGSTGAEPKMPTATGAGPKMSAKAEATGAGPKMPTAAPKPEGASARVCRDCERLEQCEDFPAITPFKTDHTGAAWRKITDPALFPMEAPGAAALVRQYRHFLYGAAQDRHLLAAPGRCLPEEQPDEGKTGFRYWQPILGMENKAPGKDTYGYWIAAINRYNGRIEEFPLIED